MTFAQHDTARPATNRFKALAELDQAAMDALPQALYLCAGDGRIVRFNQKAVELWGRAPRVGDPQERFCGSLRLYQPDGTLVAHDQSAMALALQTGDCFHNSELEIERPNGDRLTVLVNIAALRDEHGRVNGAVNCLQDITDRKREEDRQREAMSELAHRIKNTLATVHSIAMNTARDCTSLEEFTARFEARLLSLSRTHGLLSDHQRSGATLQDLLAQQLAPFGGGEIPRVRIEGPTVELEPQSTLALGMVFHELMTNAAKYGALSAAEGQISVTWDIHPGPRDERALVLEWEERGGPPVERPKRAGFGTSLIERTLKQGLDGEAEMLFETSGLRLQASIPLRN